MEARLQLLSGCAKFLRGGMHGAEGRRGGWGQGWKQADVHTEEVSSARRRSAQGRFSVCRDRGASFQPSCLSVFCVAFLLAAPLLVTAPRSENPAAISVEMQPRLALIMS